MDQILNYAKHMDAAEDVITWVDTHLSAYVEKNGLNQTEAEHIIDYLCSDKRPKRISKMSYAQAKSNTEKWNKSLIKKGKSIQETEDDIEIIKDFEDGFKIVKLVGENAYKREGFLMRHCVSSYYGNEVDIYSLRDKDNMPHCTMEDGQQVKGKGNGSINPKYVGYIVSFLEEIGMTVGDSEMKNLGYVNVEKIKEKIDIEKTDLYQDKYLYQENEIYALDGELYAEFDLWQIKPLVSKIDLNVKLNFDLSVFIPKSISNIMRKLDSSTAVANESSSTAVANESYSTAVANKSYSTAVANEHSSTAVANKSYSTAVANESYSTAVANERNSIAVCRGIKSKVNGKKGAWLVVAEYDDENENIIALATGCVDGKKIKEDTLYIAKDGVLVENSEGEE